MLCNPLLASKSGVERLAVLNALRTLLTHCCRVVGGSHWRAHKLHMCCITLHVPAAAAPACQQLLLCVLR
jgi:hypothetical protein